MTDSLFAVTLGLMSTGSHLGAQWWRARLCLRRPGLVLATYPLSLLCAACPFAAALSLCRSWLWLTLLTMWLVRTWVLRWVVK